MSEGGSGIDRKLRDIFTAAIPFVMARRKTTGGFGATPRLPATIQDTYHALNILRLARQYCAEEGKTIAAIVREDILRAYLDTCRRSLPAGTGTTSQLLCCCRSAGLELDPDAVEAAAIDRMQAADSLEEWYYCAGILVEVVGGKLPLIAEAQGLAAILDRGWRTVDEAWMHMYLSQKFRDTLPRPAPELIAWFRACQNGDGGFGFFPGTTSFVENCHASLWALAFLGAAPTVPDQVFDFLRACQTASGGFSRSPRAAAFLDATWHALAGIALISYIMHGSGGKAPAHDLTGEGPGRNAGFRNC
jgi:prenyltransferase beta subunit